MIFTVFFNLVLLNLSCLLSVLKSMYKYLSVYISSAKEKISFLDYGIWWLEETLETTLMNYLLCEGGKWIPITQLLSYGLWTLTK